MGKISSANHNLLRTVMFRAAMFRAAMFGAAMFGAAMFLAVFVRPGWVLPKRAAAAAASA